MTYTVKHARSGLTAIAAVLALSSTPLVAQEVTAPPDPVADTTAPAADPLAPEPTASEPAATETSATTAAPAQKATTTRRTATRTKTTTTTTRRAASEPASAAAASATPISEATADAMPVPPPTGAMVDPGAMPVDETAAVETTAAPVDDALPIAGAAGLGLLALGGIGMAIGRRRQRKEELAHQRANREYLDSHPDTPESHAPAFAHTATPAMADSAPGPILKDAPRTNLPPNFDLSRFGPHVRAAYQGPTADNPSLSMKHRLRRAAALDQQARHHGEVPRETVQVAARPDQAKKPMWNSGNDGFMLRRAGSKQPSKPAFQH